MIPPRPPRHPHMDTPLCDVVVRHKPMVRHHLDEGDAAALVSMTMRPDEAPWQRMIRRDQDGGQVRHAWANLASERAERDRLLGLRVQPDTPEEWTAEGHDGAGTWYAFRLDLHGEWRLERIWRT